MNLMLRGPLRASVTLHRIQLAETLWRAPKFRSTSHGWFLFLVILLQAFNSCQRNTNSCPVVMTARFTLMTLISKVYEAGLLAYLWAQTQVAYAGRGTDCVPASCSTFPDWNASSLLNHCITSNIRFCKWRWCCLTLHFSSTNHFPERICAVIKRTGLLVEIIIKKLNNVKIRLFHISIQCYLFWKSDEKWVWFLKPVQAGWQAHLKHFSTTGSQRRVLHINCTCIMSYFFLLAWDIWSHSLPVHPFPESGSRR